MVRVGELDLRRTLDQGQRTDQGLRTDEEPSTKDHGLTRDCSSHAIASATMRPMFSGFMNAGSGSEPVIAE
jgi:hypothetical protein